MMIISILIDYTNGLMIEKFRENKVLTRFFLILSITLNLGLWAFCKYGDFFLTNMNVCVRMGNPAFEKSPFLWASSLYV